MLKLDSLYTLVENVQCNMHVICCNIICSIILVIFFFFWGGYLHMSGVLVNPFLLTMTQCVQQGNYNLTTAFFCSNSVVRYSVKSKSCVGELKNYFHAQDLVRENVLPLVSHTNCSRFLTLTILVCGLKVRLQSSVSIRKFNDSHFLSVQLFCLCVLVVLYFMTCESVCILN